MEETEQIIRAHLSKYPELSPKDLIKLVYQSEFGPAHAIPDPQRVIDGIRREAEKMGIYEEDMLTPIGNGLARLDLGQALKLYSPEQIAEWFISTASARCGSLEHYLETLHWLDQMIETLPVSFTVEAWKEELSEHQRKGYQDVHHSEHYAELYHPHYRLVLKEYVC